MCSRDQLRAADSYSDVHAFYHENRTDLKMHEDYLESQGLPQGEKYKHINGIWRKSLFFEFPYFETSKEHSYSIKIVLGSVDNLAFFLEGDINHGGLYRWRENSFPLFLHQKLK